MGTNNSKIVDEENLNLIKNHNLEIDETLASTQIQEIEKFNKKKLYLSYKTKTMIGLLDYEHWFITDETMVIEFGAGEFLKNTVIVHNNPHVGYSIEEKFDMTTEVKARMKQVCGMTNYSLALRNCEHMARYIQSGVWVSFQMSVTGPLHNIFFDKMALKKKKLINKFPIGLQKEKKEKNQQMYAEMGRHVQLTDSHATFNTEDKDSFNMLIIGPTGCGKSSLINLLFNANVNTVGGSALSVTKEVNITKGEITTYENHKGKLRKTTVMDTVGFCDSKLTAAQVLTIVKTSVKTNVAHIDKVVIVCSGRIELEHAKAIKTFMSWLQYEKYKHNFVFIYNKADSLTPAEKTENVLQMSELLGASQTTGEGGISKSKHNESFATMKIKNNLALGFPPSASYDQIKDDHDKLLFATAGAIGGKRIPVDERSCTIL